MTKKDKYWQQLWFAMAEGNHQGIKELKALDCFEFYARYEVWQEHIQEKIEALKS